MQHPCGIEPWGNFYMRGGGPNIRDAGMPYPSYLRWTARVCRDVGGGNRIRLAVQSCPSLPALDPLPAFLAFRTQRNKRSTA